MQAGAQPESDMPCQASVGGSARHARHAACLLKSVCLNWISIQSFEVSELAAMVFAPPGLVAYSP